MKNEKKISPEAYEMFLKAKYLNNTSKNKVDKQLVIDLFKRAIKMDRNFNTLCFNKTLNGKNKCWITLEIYKLVV